MTRGQEHVNRSHGQKIRRTNEAVAALTEGHEQVAAVLGQHDRDIKFLKARVAELERERSRK
ncbi:hypothetical protein [Geodermatophilus sp. SYSU D00698]